MRSMVTNVPLSDRFNSENIIGTDANDDSYKAMPISNFGLEMLKNMGWSETRGIGLNPTNALMTPIEYTPRHSRSGLGALSK